MPRLSVTNQLAKIRKARAALEAKEKQLMSRTNERELARIVAIARAAKLSAADIAKALAEGKGKGAKAGGAKKSKTGRVSSQKGVKVPPRYRNPTNPTQTWTGRGVAPGWAAQLREAGQLEANRIMA